MAWLLLKGRLPWSGLEYEEEIKRQIQDVKTPDSLASACDAPAPGQYLKKVRALNVDDDPDYQGLLEMLKVAAGACIESLESLNLKRRSREAGTTLKPTRSKVPRRSPTSLEMQMIYSGPVTRSRQSMSSPPRSASKTKPSSSNSLNLH